MHFGPLWLYLVHFVHFGPLQYTLVLFSPHRSYSVLLNPIRSILSTLVLFGPLLLWSYLVLFGPHWSYSVYSNNFGLLWSYSVHSFHFGPISSIRSNLVLFDPLCSTLVPFGSIRSTFLSHLT